MKKIFTKSLLAAGVMVLSSAAYAECTTQTAVDDLEAAEVQTLYDCIKEKMRTGYAAADNAWAKEYTSWGATATLPAAPGTHGGRHLFTFANDVAFDEYVKFADERGPMPTGSVLAKESFKVTKKGKVKAGPLFFMEKVAAGNADEFGNWVYSAYNPKGKPMKIKQKFCHDCHGKYSAQDALGYPVPDVRIAAQ